MTSSRRVDALAAHLAPPAPASTPASTPAAAAAAAAAALSPSPTLASDQDNLAGRVVDTYRTLTGPVEYSAAKHGGVLAARVLKEHGVTHIFSLSGGHIAPVIVAAEQIGIKLIDVRHEVAAAFAADAYARMSGRIGVCGVTAGPGVVNTVCSLVNSVLAESPVLLIGGASANLQKGRGALQDIDQLSILKSVCKFAATVTSIRDIAPVLRRAIREALSGVPGPVFVELPLDVLYPITEIQSSMGFTERKYRKDVKPEDESRIVVPVEFKDAKDYLAKTGPLSAIFLEPTQKNMPWYLEAYMKYQLRHMFAGAWEETEFGPLPVSVPQPRDADVDATVALLRNAQRPVIVIGSQATLGGQAAAAKLVQAVERVGAPVFLGGMARGLLGAKSGTLHIRQERGKALKQADVILLLGAVCDFRLGYGRELPPPSKCKIVTVNRSRATATMNSGVFWSYEIAAESDPALFLRAVAERTPPGLGARFVPWVDKLREVQKKKESANAAKAKERAVGRVPKWANGPTRPDDAGPELLNPLAVCQAIEDVLPDDAILVADGGDFVATASYILRPRGPLQWLDPGAFGTLGVGGGFAIGAKAACPDKTVVLIWGDGSSAYSLAEIDTGARHGLPFLSVIGNDAAWNQIEREQVPMFQLDSACALAYNPYELVAKGYGGEGVAVSDPKVDLRAVVREGLDRMKQTGKPYLINALIGRTNFREGSISV